MEGLSKNLPIEELIRQTNALMGELGYAETTMRHFRQAWNALKNHAKARGMTHLTEEFGNELLREHYRIEPYEPCRTSFKMMTRRAIQLLLEYQVTGQIAKRRPSWEHSFPVGYKDVCEKYLEYIQTQKQLKSGTMRTHFMTLEAVCGYFDSLGVHSIDKVDIILLNAYLKTYAGCAKSYISGKINILRRFFTFALENGYTATEMTFPKVSVYKDRKVPDYYTADETMRLLSAVDRANPKGKRDYAMLLLGARYGLRVCDIKNLEMKNIDFANHAITITQQKTQKPLQLDLLPDVGWAIIDYLKSGRPLTECPKIFVRHVVPYESFGEYDSVAHIIGKYAQSVGIKKKPGEKNSFHMLRYGIASTLLMQGVSLTDISGILGHSELNVTTLYTKIDVPQLRVCTLEVPQ